MNGATPGVPGATKPGLGVKGIGPGVPGAGPRGVKGIVPVPGVKGDAVSPAAPGVPGAGLAPGVPGVPGNALGVPPPGLPVGVLGTRPGPVMGVRGIAAEEAFGVMGMEFAIGVDGTVMKMLLLGVEGMLFSTSSDADFANVRGDAGDGTTWPEGVRGIRKPGCAGVAGAPALAVAMASDEVVTGSPAGVGGAGASAAPGCAVSSGFGRKEGATL